MQFRWNPFAMIIMAGGAVLATSLVVGQVQKIPVTVPDETDTRQDTQTLMQAKLVHSQKVLEGLVIHDFEAIEKAAASLSRISLSPPPDLKKAGDKSDEQVYEHFRMEFARLAGQLEGHARREELEATAYVQQNLTATCIACHDYMRDNLRCEDYADDVKNRIAQDLLLTWHTSCIIENSAVG